MKVYLVGGAVRDTLLGLPIVEKDWVVVGATPKKLLDKGYKQVGKDFPVFLHPKTSEEYALARTERKQGSGYYGFTCNYDSSVTLTEDLARRDLTINAMAMDDKGQIIDPYHGQDDIKAKIIRHVSPAFIEDPVRVLRVARFTARFKPLGFMLANDTRKLMYEMVRNGELDHLVSERVWQEWFRSLSEIRPDVFITTLRCCGALKVVLPELNQLFGVPLSPVLYPEVDCGEHTLNVLRATCKLTDDAMIRFASITYAIGKGLTSMGQWPDHNGYEQLGLEALESLAKRLRVPSDYRKFARMACQYVAVLQNLDDLDANEVVAVLEKVDAFRRPLLLKQLLVLCQAEWMCMGKAFNLSDIWEHALVECQQISVQSVIEEGYQGEKIKTELHKRRVNRLQSILKK
jgi:tRNA nucleotidyltransferase (CCA-adding enzyme)